MEQHKTKRFMRRAAVEDATGLPTSTLYDKIAARDFPKPVPLGPRSVAWVEDEVIAWQETQIAKRDHQNGPTNDNSRVHPTAPFPGSPHVETGRLGRVR